MDRCLTHSFTFQSGILREEEKTMNMQLKVKTMLLSGLLIMGVQMQARAGEAVVVLQVPVNISELSTEVRSAEVTCRIWTTYPRHYSDADVGLQLARGSYSGIAQVRLAAPHGEHFKVGDRYQCVLVLDHNRGAGAARRIQNYAKPGSNPRTVVSGRL
jgi:hypothetical protein